MNFTNRELEVIELMANDASKREIAQKMKIKERTITMYQEKIKLKMGVKMLYAALYKFGKQSKN